MLLSPRRLPQRYNRRVQPSTRSFIDKRHARRKQYRRERLKRSFHRFRRQFEHWQKIAARSLAAIATGCVLLLAGILLFSPVLSVREIRIQRSDARIDIEAVQRLLRPLFGRHLFFLSSQEVLPLLQNGLPADKTHPAEHGIPDLIGVGVTKSYPSTLHLKLTLDPLLARVNIVVPGPAAALPKAATGSLEPSADFLTSKGIYVRYRPDQVQDTAALPVLKLVDWGVRPVPWTPLLDAAFLRTMQRAEVALVEQFGQQVKERTIFLRAREFHLQTNEYALWFDLKSPLEQQLLRYRIFLQHAGKGAAKEYVDLRLTEKVVYR